MDANAGVRILANDGSRFASAEQRLRELGVTLPQPPEPFGTYVEAVQTGNLLLSGMLPTEGPRAKFTGRVGAELDVEQGRNAAQLAALNVLAVARKHLGSLDKVTALSGLVSRLPLLAIFAISRMSPMPLRIYCKVFSEKTRTLADCYTAWLVFRSARRSSWK